MVESSLKDVKIHNGIDTNTLRSHDHGNLKIKYNLSDQNSVLLLPDTMSVRKCCVWV